MSTDPPPPPPPPPPRPPGGGEGGAPPRPPPPGVRGEGEEAAPPDSAMPGSLNSATSKLSRRARRSSGPGRGRHSAETALVIVVTELHSRSSRNLEQEQFRCPRTRPGPSTAKRGC